MLHRQWQFSDLPKHDSPYAAMGLRNSYFTLPSHSMEQPNFPLFRNNVLGAKSLKAPKEEFSMIYSTRANIHTVMPKSTSRLPHAGYTCHTSDCATAWFCSHLSRSKWNCSSYYRENFITILHAQLHNEWAIQKINSTKRNPSLAHCLHLTINAHLLKTFISRLVF